MALVVTGLRDDLDGIDDRKKQSRDAVYWEEVMAGQNFGKEDDLEEARFNLALWHGLLGESAAYPTARDGRDWSQDRQRLLREYQQRNPGHP